MTEKESALTDEVYQTYSTLLDSVCGLDELTCMIPHGGDDENLGILLRIVLSRVQSDLKVHFNAMVSLISSLRDD